MSVLEVKAISDIKFRITAREPKRIEKSCWNGVHQDRKDGCKPSSLSGERVMMGVVATGT